MLNFLFALLAKVVRGIYSILMMFSKLARLFGTGFFCFLKWSSHLNRTPGQIYSVINF
jgi:hypothetical protein